MRLVYAVAAEARSIAFLKRAVAISSIVRVILRMLRIDLRRLSSKRGLAIGGRGQRWEVRGQGEPLISNAKRIYFLPALYWAWNSLIDASTCWISSSVRSFFSAMALRTSDFW